MGAHGFDVELCVLSQQAGVPMAPLKIGKKVTANDSYTFAAAA